MAKEFEFECSAHPVVDGVDRTQKVYFSTPEVVNQQSGILLLIAGFGGAPDANVYKKMRRVFADTYNLIIVQTAYLGTEFMGEITECQFFYDRFNQFYENFTIPNRANFITPDGQVKLSELFSMDSPSLKIPLLTVTKETETNYVEMGPLQAIDCVNALMTVQGILRDNDYVYNENKILAFGHSHGAYLALLANCLFPSLFSMIVDGSGWLLPVYLSNYRLYDGKYKNHNILKYTKYWIFDQKYDNQIRDLRFLYQNFDNQANIITYQSVDDKLVDSKEKANLFAQITNTVYNLVTPELIDGRIFKSTAHGDFDFLLLLEHVLDTYPELTEKKDIPIVAEKVIETNFARYRFYIENFGPHMVITNR